MLNFGIILAFIFLAFLHLADAVNYCDPVLCTSNNRVKNHIACQNSGKFESTCEEAGIVTITSQLQKAILFLHNDLRNKVANGSLPRFQSAQRMTTITWDNELAYLAGLNVLRCVLEHDECHNTFSYKYSGQNLAIQYQSNTIAPATYENVIVYLINEWFNENKDANQGDVNKCSAQGLAKNIGHFTAMIQEKSAKVGCGLAKFSKVILGRRWYALLLACNYSFTNMVDMPIYVKGRMCSACQTGCNPDFNGLCSLAENVPPIHDLDARPEDSLPPRVGLTVPSARMVERSPSGRSIRPDNNQLIVPSVRTVERTPSGRSLRPPDNVQLNRPIRPVPSARMLDLMRTADTVVRPFEPGQTFYIRDEPNPVIRANEIIRPVPIVTWRGPRTATVFVSRVKWPFDKYTRM